MKRCPECAREYDNAMMFCLDDGAELLYGPRSEPGAVGFPGDEPQTAILHSTASAGDAPTRAQIQTTEQTAVFPRGAEAEPRESLGGLSERQSHSAHRAAKPLIAAVVAVAVLAGGFFGYRYFSSGATKQIESIAVMPFVNESGNADVEYLSDGMTETLIGSLSKLANLNVKGRSSVFRFKGKELDTKTLGSELGVQAVLYGRVIQRGDQITVSLELLDALTENVIWSGRYDRKQSDVVSLQSEIARDVSNRLKSKLSGEDIAKVGKRHTDNPEAYRLYLQGRFFWNKRNESDVRRSIEHFNQAIVLDPGYALAYAGLADANLVLPLLSRDEPPSEVFIKARTAAQQALMIDPNLGEPHATLAVVLHQLDWNFPEAEKEFKRSIELDPNYPTAHQWYGEFLANMGRFDEAIAEVRLARQLDPMSTVINMFLGRCLALAGRYDEALAQYKSAFDLDPNYLGPQAGQIDAFIAKGMYQQAIERQRERETLEGVPRAETDAKAAALTEAYRRSGENGYWRKTLELEERAARERNSSIPSYDLAVLNVRIGNHAEALDQLEKAAEDRHRYPWLLGIKANPVWAPLRPEPRFQALLQKLGFP